MSRIRNFRKPQPSELRFHALLTEVDTKVRFYREMSDRAGEDLT